MEKQNNLRIGLFWKYNTGSRAFLRNEAISI